MQCLKNVIFQLRQKNTGFKLYSQSNMLLELVEQKALASQLHARGVLSALWEICLVAPVHSRTA